ncbi:MAG TPA: biotin transporter BioY [Bauldia sp.]|nr:biotin transporter BioY [Bauldia sp.]
MPTNTYRAALAPSLLSGRSSAVQELILVLAGTAVLYISGKISVPFYPVPMTLQTLAVMAIAAAYGMRLGTLTVLAYLAEGAVGIPVFTATPPAIAGLTYFLGPTGGFLAGFIPLAVIVGYAADRGWDRSPVRLFGAMLVADVVLFALGFLWLALFAHVGQHTGLGFASAFKNGVVPFVLGDLLKIALASALVPAVWGLVGKR